MNGDLPLVMLCAALASACSSSALDQPTADAGAVDGGAHDSAIGGAADSAIRDAAAPKPDATSGDPGALCAGRRGGALITLGNPPGTLDGPDQIVLWITDSPFIDTAIQLQASGQWKIPSLDEVIAGADCDPTHAWHVNPAKATWVDVAREECDSTITNITQHLAAWTGRSPPDWCEWSGVVIAVQDRR